MEGKPTSLQPHVQFAPFLFIASTPVIAKTSNHQNLICSVPLPQTTPHFHAPTKLLRATKSGQVKGLCSKHWKYVPVHFSSLKVLSLSFCSQMAFLPIACVTSTACSELDSTKHFLPSQCLVLSDGCFCLFILKFPT